MLINTSNEKVSMCIPSLCIFLKYVLVYLKGRCLQLQHLQTLYFSGTVIGQFKIWLKIRLVSLLIYLKNCKVFSV